MARPPDLIDDAVTEILLRLPPDDPACLVRASLVCKAWRELLTGPAFLRRYRAFHGAPPLLGYSHNVYDEVPYARFVAADARASPFSAPAFGRLNWWVLECRHGRVLVQSFERHASSNLLVWDPITGVQHQVPVHMTYFCHTAAVLCGVAGCDHLNCHGGPFLVVSICIPYEEEEEQAVDFISACVYSSETGACTSSPSIQFDAYIEERPSLLARDALYFTLQQGRRILKYDLVGQGLQVIDAPDMFDGLAYGNLHLWSWQAGPYGVAEWVQGRVIKLSTLLPTTGPLISLGVIGFLEGGTYTIFVSTDVGIFAVMPKSEQMKKVCEGGFHHAIAPYMSFYTPGTGGVLIFNLYNALCAPYTFLWCCFLLCSLKSFSQTISK
ncbi:hypothetical protein HU200_004510 [Digitaria exilis]|uniref:F-box domain-containing protein n=1 Tax=Digitaria exilis TaxID=1010633 RepID=A0A835FTI7_9POAL|nr:hypothetical protein HU200_004510 [Digitaria exilis]